MPIAFAPAKAAMKTATTQSKLTIAHVVNLTGLIAQNIANTDFTTLISTHKTPIVRISVGTVLVQIAPTSLPLQPSSAVLLNAEIKFATILN